MNTIKNDVRLLKSKTSPGLSPPGLEEEEEEGGGGGGRRRREFNQRSLEVSQLAVA
jgi:hypothetical protein